MRILLVEDDMRMSASVAAYLRASGYAVDEAPDGAAALRLSAMNPYDAVVLDLHLPDVDGLEVCRRLLTRHRPNEPHGRLALF
jgi:DNA-binding response OmpR family regulator